MTPVDVTADELRLWVQKWRWYERNSLPWNRARIHWELMRRRAFARWPLHGNVLEAMAEDRLRIGEQVLFEPGVWITAPGSARIEIGAGTFLNQGVMVAAMELVQIGEHCMFANGCFVTDADHRFDDLTRPITWQGFTTKGPTRIGDNVWCGANVVVTGGVTIGERSVIGANSVVTRDIPPFSIAAGAPARVLRTHAGADPRPADEQGRLTLHGGLALQRDGGARRRRLSLRVAYDDAQLQPLELLGPGLGLQRRALPQRGERHRQPVRGPSRGDHELAAGEPCRLQLGAR